MGINIEISLGELLDKITILEIKSSKIKKDNKLKNVNFELYYLNSYLKTIDIDNDIKNLKNQLYKINKKLWEIEDRIRIHEKNKNFNNEFIELARSVYMVNDERAQVKREINTIYSSEFIEEKEYVEYE